MNNGLNQIHLGDCLEIMKRIPSQSIDMILCDLPYGTTNCKWDAIIPLPELWGAYHRIAKPNAAIVLTASQPFTSALVMSNPKAFRYSWTWDKGKAGVFAFAKKQPLRVTEEILVFSQAPALYFPQMEQAREGNKRPRHVASSQRGDMLNRIGKNEFRASEGHDESLRYPKNLISISSVAGDCNPRNRIHPTQKPVPLFEYLIKTYTNENGIVLDNCIGSGTTAIAAINTKRRWVGIEKDPSIFTSAVGRVNAHLAARS